MTKNVKWAKESLFLGEEAGAEESNGSFSGPGRWEVTWSSLGSLGGSLNFVGLLPARLAHPSLAPFFFRIYVLFDCELRGSFELQRGISHNGFITFRLQVYNVVPSISAVTGISPGRYLWRVVIAFHIGPRMLIAAVYYNFLMSFVPFLVGPEAPNKAEWLTKLLKCCYYLQVSEVVGLCVISFVHNREHYREYKLVF